ncbi:efflux RND transporter periplasmic adaptor subunit [Patescibacteria group bacterium]
MKLLQSIFTKFRQSSRKKKLIITIVVLILGLIGYAIWQNATKSPKYTLASAEYSSIEEIVSETGNVTTAGAVPIYTTTTGMVEEVFIQNGDFVEENDILYRVKSTATKLEQDTALSNYLTAVSALETAKSAQFSLQADMFSKWESFKELAEGDDFENDDGSPKEYKRELVEFHIPQKTWLAAETAYKTQQQIINQASAQVSATWQAYQSTQDSEVIAQIGGEIRNLGVARGDIVKVPTALTLASTIPTVILIERDVPTIVKLNINENDANKIQVGQDAGVEFDAISGTSFSAIVDRVDTIPTIESVDVVKFSVYIIIEEPSDLIKRGMTTDVDIIVANKDHILTVPSSAVKPYQGGKAVRVVGGDGEIEFIPVQVGSKGDGKIEIVSGIQEGDQVIVTLANDQVERSGGLF